MTLQPKGLPPTHLINLPAHAIILLVNLFQKAALMLHPQSSSATHKGGKKKREAVGLSFSKIRAKLVMVF